MSYSPLKIINRLIHPIAMPSGSNLTEQTCFQIECQGEILELSVLPGLFPKSVEEYLDEWQSLFFILKEKSLRKNIQLTTGRAQFDFWNSLNVPIPSPPVAFSYESLFFREKKTITSETSFLLYPGDQVTNFKEGSTIKIKIGRNELASEISFLKDIQKKRPDLILRLDANGGLQAQTIEVLTQELELSTIEYIEDPFHEIPKNWSSSLPLAIDLLANEVVLNADKYQHIKTLIIKPTLQTGYLGTIDLFHQFPEKTIVISSSFDGPQTMQDLYQLNSKNPQATLPGFDTVRNLKAMIE